MLRLLHFGCTGSKSVSSFVRYASIVNKTTNKSLLNTNPKDTEVFHKATKKDQSKEKLQDEGDTFGTLSDRELKGATKTTLEKMQEMDLEQDEEDDKPHVRLSAYQRRHSPIWYGRKIEKLSKQGKLFEAIEMLETLMLKEDRVLPSPYVYASLIGALGRVGYTKKAFRLFNDMKKMGIQPADPTYTGLFNACANSPWKDDGLARAKNLHQHLLEKDIDLNVITYNAIIKAYGFCGDLLLAFSVVDEMTERGVKPNELTYTALLMACISDKEAGLKHAVEVWRRLRKRKAKIELVHYNLLLRAVRDCGVGDQEFAQQLLNRGTASLENSGNKEKVIKQLQSGTEPNDKKWWQHEVKSPTLPTVPSKFSQDYHESQIQTSGLSISVLDSQVPNLLNPKAKFRSVVGLDSLDTGTARLALLGGLPGMIRHMAADTVKPDIRTFALLLDTIPSNRSAEEDLLNTLSAHKVPVDIGLLNLLIKKRNLRKDSEGVAVVLKMMSALKLLPNIQTFGCLAMGCSNKLQAQKLVEDMENLGMIPNAEIFNILAYQANMDFSYRLMLLKQTQRLETKPEKLFISRMEKAVAKARNILVQVERGELEWERRFEEKFRKDFKNFMMFYKGWLLQTGIETETHPWEQYRKPSTDDTNVEQDL